MDGFFVKLRGTRYPLLVLNLLFAGAAVIGQVGQNVSLPLWISATDSFSNPNCSGYNENSSNTSAPPQMDAYFVLSSATISFVVIFGISLLVVLLVQYLLNTFSTEKRYSFITMHNDVRFPQWQLMLIGFFDALNGILVVFASPPTRTAPFLQAILSNVSIPLIIVFR